MALWAPERTTRHAFSGGYIKHLPDPHCVEVTFIDGQAQAFITEREPTEVAGRVYITSRREVGLRLQPAQWDALKVHIAAELTGERAAARPAWSSKDLASAALVDELKAVIVSQAREIARLKGESE